MSDKQLLVSKIENGIVIDHIPSGKAFLVLKLLKVDPKARTLIAQNVESRSQGTKDLIKIEGSYLTSKEIDLIAEDIGRMGKQRYEERLVTEKEDHFQVFLIAALICFIVFFLIGEGRRHPALRWEVK